MVAWPQLPFARGFGAGLDLRYGDPFGFEHVPGRGDVLAERMRRFLALHEHELDYRFYSWQPKDRGLLDPEDYYPVWDGLFAGRRGCVGLHHTALNLASIDERPDRGRLLDFTNALIERYDLRWVNEDVGIWSIDGKLMPYPLPPILSLEGLASTTRQLREVAGRLAAPLIAEFPGFSEGTNFVLGALDAYDYFRELILEADVACALDTGHLLSYRFLRGFRGEALYDELERLPLERCFEIHLSGCQLIDGRFMDVHHGVLLEEQLELLGRLLPRCPMLRAVAYEDPKPDALGALRPKALPGFRRLSEMMWRWRGGEDARVA